MKNIVWLVVLILTGCVSQPSLSLSARNTFGVPAYEYACGTKEKEDRFLDGDTDKWEDAVKQDPRLIADLARIIEYANDIRCNCRPEEVVMVDAALEKCWRVIPDGTEVERIEAFRNLHEFHRRCVLRMGWRAAKIAANEKLGVR